MEYAKDKILKVRYNKVNNVLEIPEKKTICSVILKNKLISTIIISTLIAVVVDCLLIYEFINTLSTL